MPTILKPLLTFAKSDYLGYFWWLVFGYAGCYLVALGLAWALSNSSEHTVLSRCRKAWAIAFLAHTLASLGVAAFWFIRNGMFGSFWQFFPLYMAVVLVDVCFTGFLFASRQQYAHYHK